MRRPLLWVAAFHGAGILAGNWLEPPLALLYASAGLTLLACAAFARLRPLLIWLLVFLVGWSGMTQRSAVLSPHDLRSLVAADAEQVTLRGRLRDTPRWRLYPHQGVFSTNSLAEIQVRAWKRGEEWAPAYGRVAVTTRGPLPPAFFAGRNVEIAGVLMRPAGAAAEGLFDYRDHLAHRGIHFQLSAESPAAWRTADAPGEHAMPPLADRFRTWAQGALARGLPEPDDALRLNWAMLLGWTPALTSEVSAPFMRSGTMHIFAISGLHIALIAGILVNLLRVLRIPRGACGIGVIPAIWFYTAATGWQASAVRSSLMMTLVIGGWALRRPVDLLNSLAASAFIILAGDPRQLFQASFQLSFFAVLSIALLLPRFETGCRQLLRHDPLLPDDLLPAWRRRLDPPLRFLATSLATSLAAWLGSAPIVAAYFHLFTPVSLLANLVVIPLSSLALMSGLGSLLCGDWLPGLAVLFNHSGWFWMKSMVAVSEACARLPGAWLHVPAPGPAAGVAYYGLLAALSTGWLLEHRRWRLAAALSLALAAAILTRGWMHRADVALTVLPLRAGDAILADAPGREGDALIDCGDESGARRLVVPFLKAQGWNTLPNLVLTHGDSCHVSGAVPVLVDLDAQRLVTSDVRFRSAAYRRVVNVVSLGAAPTTPQAPGGISTSGPAGGRPAEAREEVRSAPASRREHRRLSRGDRLGPWQVLHPAAGDRFALADDSALVLRGEFHGARVLLCSDLGRVGQRTLLEREPDLRADWVVAGIPGGGEPLTEPFLEAVRPRAVILSTGEYPAREQPSLALRSRLLRCGAPVFMTTECGLVRLVIRPGGWELRTGSGERLRAGLEPAS